MVVYGSENLTLTSVVFELVSIIGGIADAFI